jgi:3-dehydroquinate synthase
MTSKALKGKLNITVPASEATSPIWVGRGIISVLNDLLKHGGYSTVALIGEENAKTFVSHVAETLDIPEGFRYSMPGGEDCKSLSHLEQLWSHFAKLKLDRKSLVLVVGGGAVSDLVGFAAATYMRGIACAVVPTTLLSQVDAGIGGKSGINFNGVKNLIGAIAQPVAILVDIDALATLPQRELRSGFAEIAKHGLIADKTYFDKVTSRTADKWSGDELVELVLRSCEIKSSIVQSDINELGPRRAVNFGHSLGHAVEAYSHLKTASPLTHGEAVAIGMHAACFISHRLGLLKLDELNAACEGILRVGLPTHTPTPYNPDSLIELLALDKKSVGGVTRWTLLDEIGCVVVDRAVPEDVVREAIVAITPAANNGA